MSAAGQIAAIRAVLERFDWERDDRQYALERIEEIATRPPEPLPADISGDLLAIPAEPHHRTRCPAAD